MSLSSSPPRMKMKGGLTNVGAAVPSGDYHVKNIAAQRAAPTFKTAFSSKPSLKGFIQIGIRLIIGLSSLSGENS